MAHRYHEALRAVHQYVVVHLSIARLEYVEHVLAVGGVHNPAQREEGEGLGGGTPRPTDPDIAALPDHPDGASDTDLIDFALAFWC